MGLATPPEGIIAPRELPDGRLVWEETGGDAGDAVERLRAYDPRCSLVRNVIDDQWEVHRKCEDGIARRIGAHKGARPPHGERLVRELAEHDTRRGYDPLKAIDAHNAAVDRERDRRMDDEFEDKADRFRFALNRDLGGLA